MNVSGVLVVVPAAKFDAGVEALGTLPGVEVHHLDRKSCRLVVTIEATSIGAEVEILKRIKDLPQVALAEMVHHHFEDDDEIIENLPSELEEQGGSSTVPPTLRD